MLDKNALKTLNMQIQRRLSKEILQKIVQRIVEVAQPDRIILFGSAARGEIGPHNDVDLLVVKSGEFDYHRLIGDIYMDLHGVGQAVDIILVTPEQIERYRDSFCLVIAPALKEGMEVYRRQEVAHWVEGPSRENENNHEP